MGFDQQPFQRRHRFAMIAAIYYVAIAPGAGFGKNLGAKKIERGQGVRTGQVREPSRRALVRFQ